MVVGMWRTTVSARRLAVLTCSLVLGLALALSVTLLQWPDRRESAEPADETAVSASAGSGTRDTGRDADGPAAERGTSQTVAGHDSDPGARLAPPGRAEPTSTPPTPTSPAPNLARLSEQDRAQARQAAADFITAYTTFHHDEPADDRMARMRPLVTDTLVATLRQDDGGDVGERQLAARRQVTTATVAQTQPHAAGDGWMDVRVIVRLDRTTVDGERTEWASHLTRVVRTPEGWKVDGFRP